MSDKIVKKMIGAIGKPPTPMKDSDGDGLGDMIDCQPYNKHKQGFIHDLAAKGLRKVGATGAAERVEERGERSDTAREERREERTETKKLAREARVKEIRRFNVEKEKIRTDTAISRLKARKKTNVIQQFASGFSRPRTRTAPRTTTRRTVTVKRRKSRTRTAPRTTTRRAAPKKKLTLHEFTNQRFGGGL